MGVFMKIFNLICMMLLICHWSGCLQVIIMIDDNDYDNDDNDDNYNNDNNDDNYDDDDDDGDDDDDDIVTSMVIVREGFKKKTWKKRTG